MLIRKVLAHQLARPSGLPGLFMGRTLDRVNARVNALALQQLQLQPNDRLLDVGFGGGLLIREALTVVPDVRIVGIDVSYPMLDRGRREFRAQIASGQVAIVEADVAAIPCPGMHFDKVAAINTLHFWPDPHAGLLEIRRVMKPGARLVIAVRPKAFLERIRFTQYGFRAFDDGELRTLLERTGLECLEIAEHPDKDMGSVHVVGRRPF